MRIKSLVVDDDKLCASTFKLELSKYGECDIVNDGIAAIKAYEESINSGNPYKLMLLDIIMPNLDGGQVLKQIREIEEQKKINDIDKLRIIITTAYDDWYNRSIIISNLNPIYESFFIKAPDLHELVDKIQDLGFIID